MIKSLLKGTLILTAAGLITKVIGFLYKIYLSNILEARMLGIYQLTFPVFGICFTLFGAGIQTAISQIIAANSRNVNKMRKILIHSTVLSLFTACILSATVYLYSDSIAIHILGEPECAPMLRLLVFAFPLCATAVCINGCYYGLKKATVPALTQLIEQIARVMFVYIAISLIPVADRNITCMIAVTGIAIGEGVSMLYSLIMILRMFYKLQHNNTHDSYTDNHSDADNTSVIRNLLRIALPLTGNKLVIAVLHSIETIMIPVMLKLHGMSADEALSVYGVLTGMALPFVLFPSTITNSLAVLLLPTVSEASQNSDKRLKRVSGLCITGSLILGIASTAIFLIFGADIGALVFHNPSIGLFIRILAFLCPFIFVSTTLSSIINGLGKTHITFFITIIGLAIRILITVKYVPANGISGYLISLLVSEVAVTILSLHYYKKTVKQVSTNS